MRCHEGGGDRWQYWWGDIGTWDEEQSGARFGQQFAVEISRQHIGDFDTEHRRHSNQKFAHLDTDKHEYLTWHFSIMLWRWGVSVNVRGREITDTTWDIPRSHLDSNGELLPDYR